MRLSQPPQSTPLAHSSHEAPVTENVNTAVTKDEAIQHSPLRSAYLKSAIIKISSRSKTASPTKTLSPQTASITGAQLKVGAESRPYLRQFLAGLELDKNRK